MIKTEESYCECASDNTHHLYRDLHAEGVVHVFQEASDDDFIQKWSFLIRVEIKIKQLGVSFMDLKFKNMRICSSREYRDLVPFDNLST